MLPYLTEGIAGVGGTLRAQPEDFVVEEIPAYPPSGTGSHVFAQLQKRGLTTAAAVGAIARALGANERDIGVAGQKDRHAVTTQWLSLPPPVTPEAVLALTVPDVTIVAAHRHEHKLRTGHLRGNRFVIRIRDITGRPEDAARALARLAQAPGVPNFYGEQRFGAAGDNAAQARQLIKSGNRRSPNARFLLSALQSELFNTWLTARMADGLFAQAVAGDIMHKVGGGLFDCEDVAIDGPRLSAGEIVATGPMLGHAMRTPRDGTEAHAREAVIFRAAELSPADFRPFGNLAEGTRRDASVQLSDVDCQADGPDLVARFTLPSGAYATIVLRELMKPV